MVKLMNESFQNEEDIFPHVIIFVNNIIYWENYIEFKKSYL